MFIETNDQLRRPVPLAWQLIVLFVSVAVVFVLTISLLHPLPKEIVSLLQMTDFFICAIFFADFLLLLYLHKNRTRYFLTWGWIDLLSSIPVVNAFRWGRLARLIRIIRVLRALHSGSNILKRLFENRQQLAFVAISVCLLIVLVFGSAAMLVVEETTGSGIKTAEDALWFTLVTITAVGYGDLIPHSELGRLIASFIMVAGVTIFGSFTALIASFLISSEAPAERAATESSEILKELQQLRSELQKIKAQTKSATVPPTPENQPDFHPKS
jgi:voltage-gated potassium channel